jgi:hypothetical protein
MNPCESLRRFWLEKFHEKGEAIMPFLVNSTLSKQLWLNKYKELPPIETMPEKEKKEMKQYVISMFPEKTIEEKLEACKIIYTIGTLL